MNFILILGEAENILCETISHTERSEVTEILVDSRLRRKKMFSEGSVHSNEVGVIANPTASELPKVFSR